MPDRAVTTAAGAGNVMPHWPNNTPSKGAAMSGMDQGNITTPNAADLNTAARKYAESQGWAMSGGGFPIRPANMHGADDLTNAIRAVGRGGAAGSTIRKHVMGRAKSIGLSDRIPDTWNADGSLNRSAVQPVEHYRSYEPDMEIKNDGTGRTIVGIAVPFNHIQQIDPHLSEAFDRGAFDHQLAAIHRVPYYQGHKKMRGIHVGHVAMARADAAGLYTESKIAATQAGDETLELHRNGSLRDQSVGFIVPHGGTSIRQGVEWRTRAHLTELAAVPNGAYGTAAPIMGVRAVDLGVVGALPPMDDDSTTGQPEGDFTATGDPDDKLTPCPECGYVPPGQQRSRLDEARRAMRDLPLILPL